MAEHEPCIGQSDDWYTTPEIFAALGLAFVNIFLVAFVELSR